MVHRHNRSSHDESKIMVYKPDVAFEQIKPKGKTLAHNLSVLRRRITCNVWVGERPEKERDVEFTQLSLYSEQCPNVSLFRKLCYSYSATN